MEEHWLVEFKLSRPSQSLNLCSAPPLISLTKEIVKQVNSVLYNFIWNPGKDKIKRLTLISDYKNGGLRMPHIETLIKTQRIMCMKKYLDCHNSTWKMFLNSYLADFVCSFIIKCNNDGRFLPKTLPKFSKECLSEWADYKKSPVVTLPDVLKEIIWNNKFMSTNGKPLFRSKVLKKGFLTVRDILSGEGKLKSWSTLQNKNLTGAKYLSLWVSLTLSHKSGRPFLKAMPNNPPRKNECRDNTFPTSSKEVYWDLIS